MNEDAKGSRAVGRDRMIAIGAAINARMFKLGFCELDVTDVRAQALSDAEVLASVQALAAEANMDVARCWKTVAAAMRAGANSFADARLVEVPPDPAAKRRSGGSTRFRFAAKDEPKAVSDPVAFAPPIQVVREAFEASASRVSEACAALVAVMNDSAALIADALARARGTR